MNETDADGEGAGTHRRTTTSGELLGFHYATSTPPTPKQTLLALHGTGGDETQVLDLAAEISPDSAIIGLRGKVQEDGSNRFFRRFAEGVFDEDDLRFRASEIAAFIEEFLKETHLPRPLIAVGYSNGANIAAGLLLMHPEVLDGAILFRAMSPFQDPPVVNLTGKKILLSNGEKDPLAPLDVAEKLGDTFNRCGATLHHRITPSGHGLTRTDIHLAQNWLKASF